MGQGQVDATEDAPVFHRFLSGADMDPSALLVAHPGARFVARARLATVDTDAASDAEPIWGILVRLPGEAGTDDGANREVTTDDGRVFRAVVAGDGRPTGDPAAVLAAARYWELPPAYVDRLPAPSEVT